MEKLEPLKTERESEPKNISAEFLRMDSISFKKFLKENKREPHLHIEIDWIDIPTARRLKAFLEDSNTWKWKQKRTASIRATREQKNQESNVFESGVEWIEIH